MFFLLAGSRLGSQEAANDPVGDPPPPPKEERELMVPDQQMIPEVSSSTL